MACLRHDNLDKSLVKAAAEIPLEAVRATKAEWPECLKACVEAKDGHFEWNYYLLSYLLTYSLHATESFLRS